MLLENYSKTINIEALTALEMTRTQIIPAGFKYAAFLAESLASVKSCGCGFPTAPQENLLEKVSHLNCEITERADILEGRLSGVGDLDFESLEHACFIRDSVFTSMENLRESVDKLEKVTDCEIWPFPTYSELLFKV
jgi:glutamine synthetase